MGCYQAFQQQLTLNFQINMHAFQQLLTYNFQIDMHALNPDTPS